MAKKKSFKSNHKHQLKYAVPTGGAVASAVKSTGAAPSGVITSERDFTYVTHDLLRVLTLGGTLVVILFVLWYLFEHTGLGPSAYNLVKF